MNLDLLDVLLMWCAVVATLYAPIYSFRPWWRNPAGRALFIKAWANLTLFDLIFARRFWGDYPYRQEATLVGMALLALGLTYLLVGMLRTPIYIDAVPLPEGNRPD